MDYFCLFHRSLLLESEWTCRGVHSSQISAESANGEACGMAAAVALGIPLQLRYSALPCNNCVAVFLAKSKACSLDIVRGIRDRLTHGVQKYFTDRFPCASSHRDLFSISSPVPGDSSG